MRFEIGKIYQIKSPYSDHQSEYRSNLSWGVGIKGSSENIKKFKTSYPTWETLDYKRIEVLNKATDTEYMVRLLDFPDVSFKIYKGYMKELDNSYVEIGCICSIEKLMLTGCRCGAFLEEMGEL